MAYKLCFSPLLMITKWKGLYISVQIQVQNKKYNDMRRARRTRCLRKDCSDEECNHNCFSNMQKDISRRKSFKCPPCPKEIGFGVTDINCSK